MKLAHRFFLALCPAFLLLTTTLLAWSQDSWTPDHDGNGFNNSFERAVDLGELKPAGINVREQLGVVPWGFDTRDMYRFVFPGGVTDFQLSVRLDEEPDTTMWINIYDRNQQLIYTSIGAKDEQFGIPLTSGLYFMEVITSREVANGRNLLYTLGARPIEVPLPEQGGIACRGAPNLGSFAQLREISGHLDEARKFSVYSFYVPFGASLSGNMLGLQPSRRYIVTATDRLNGNSIRVRDANLQMEGILVDPGFYCLRVESVGTEGYGNYRGSFIAQRAGLIPGNNKSRAQNIIDMELEPVRNW